MHLSALLQAAACLGDGDLSLQDARASPVGQNQPPSREVETLAKKPQENSRALSDSNSRYQSGHPKSMARVFKTNSAPKKAAVSPVSHSCGRAKKDEKFRFSCRLCDDFHPTTRCFNAERHIWYDIPPYPNPCTHLVLTSCPEYAYF
jgi:hypothetical protein